MEIRKITPLNLISRWDKGRLVGYEDEIIDYIKNMTKPIIVGCLFTTMSFNSLIWSFS